MPIDPYLLANKLGVFFLFSKTFLFLLGHNVYTAKHINSHLSEVYGPVTAYLCVCPGNQEDVSGTEEVLWLLLLALG